MRLGLMACLALAVAGCASMAAAEPQGDWRLAEIDGAPVIASSHPSLHLDGARASGSGGCNGFGADVARVSDQLVFTHVITTMMACASTDGGDLMAQEHAYLGALQTPLRMAIPDDDVLILSAADGRTLQFTRVAQTN